MDYPKIFVETFTVLKSCTEIVYNNNQFINDLQEDSYYLQNKYNDVRYACIYL